MNKRGSVLIFSLLFMLTLVGTLLTVSLLFTHEIKNTQDVGKSFQAYASAETGIEQSLQSIKIAREAEDSLNDTLTGLLCADASCVLDTTTYQIVLRNDSVSSLTWQTLDAFESHQLYILYPDNITVAYGSAGNAILKWSEICEIEMSLNDFPPGSWTLDEGADTHFLSSGPEMIMGLDTAFNHILRFRPMSCNIQTGLTARLEDDSGNIVNIPGIIDLKSRGTSGDVSQTLEAIVPWRATPFDLSQFTLFSEGDIAK